MRVAENNGTGGAMMRMSRPQPVSLDKGLCRTGIRSHTAENDTLPYPCDAEIRHRMSEDLERSGYIFHMLGKEISSRVPSSIMRKFVYKSGRTKSAQGREPALDYPIAEGRERVKGGEAACKALDVSSVFCYQPATSSCISRCFMFMYFLPPHRVPAT